MRSGAPVSGTRDERIAGVAALQRGRIARRQLLAIGVSSSSISWLVGHGRLRRVHRTVYVVGHDAPTELGAETAALLAVGRGAALSHLTAAAMWGIHPRPRLIHVLVGPGEAASPARVRVHRARSLDREKDIRLRHGLPVTSPARTMLDIAELLTPREREWAYDRLIVDRVLRPAQLTELLNRTKGRRATALLRPLVDGDHGQALTRSEAEERLLVLVRQAQLPAPAVNSRLLGYEVDFHWRAQRFVLEVDGFRFHSTRRAFEHDRRKDAALRAAGMATMRVTWRQLETEPYAVIVRIAQALTWSARDRT